MEICCTAFLSVMILGFMCWFSAATNFIFSSQADSKFAIMLHHEVKISINILVNYKNDDFRSKANIPQQVGDFVKVLMQICRKDHLRCWPHPTGCPLWSQSFGVHGHDNKKGGKKECLTFHHFMWIWILIWANYSFIVIMKVIIKAFCKKEKVSACF